MPSIVRVLRDGSTISAGAKWGWSEEGYLSLIQDSEDTSILNIDWTGVLDGETIVSAVWTSQNLTLTDPQIDGNHTTVRVSATPQGTWGEAKVVLTTSNGRITTKRFRYYGFPQ